MSSVRLLTTSRSPTTAMPWSCQERANQSWPLSPARIPGTPVSGRPVEKGASIPVSRLNFVIFAPPAESM